MSWIESNDCHILLKKCAYALYNQHISLIISLFGDELNYQPQGKTSDDFDSNNTTEHNINVVTNRLWEFLLKKWNHPNAHGGTLGRELQILLHNGQESSVKNIVTSYFINDCLEQQRQPSASIKDSFYRSACAYLRKTAHKDPAVQYHVDEHRWPFYAYSTDLLAKAPSDLAHSENYAAWSSPPLTSINELYFVSADNLELRRGVLGALARFYWDQSIEHLEAEYLLPVKGLAKFVESKFDFSLLKPEIVKPHASSDEDEEEAPGVIDTYQGAGAAGPYDPCKKEILKLAEDLVSTWQSNMKEIFFLYFEEEKTLNEIQSMGYPPPQYWLNMAVQRMRDQWNTWMWN